MNSHGISGGGRPNSLSRRRLLGVILGRTCAAACIQPLKGSRSRAFSSRFRARAASRYTKWTNFPYGAVT